MKNTLIIFFCLICYNVVAQVRYPTGVPTQFSTGWFRQGYQQSDSGTIIANRDTTWRPKFSGTVVFRPADKRFYYYDSLILSWFPFFVDTTSLSIRINTKLNITDTTNKWWGVGKRWVDTVYRVNDSTIGFTVNNGPQQTFQILGRAPSGGGGGSGTVTSVALSMPSAFAVFGSPITTNGTISVVGAGTASQYIRGNSTLGTTDTGMIPNFHLKVRSLFSATSPLTYNSITGAFGIGDANTSGGKGAATFLNSDFSDNGFGLISLSTLVSSGTCTNCTVTFTPDGRASAYSSGVGPANMVVDTIYRIPGKDSIFFTINSVVYAIKDSTGAGSISAINNVGGGFRWVKTPSGNIGTAYPSNTIQWDSISNVNGLTAKVDTSVIATQYDLTQVVTPPAAPFSSIQFNKLGVFGGDSLFYYPADKKILTPRDQIQYGREVKGFYQDSNLNDSRGRLWTVYPRGNTDSLRPFYSEMTTTRYDVGFAENPVFTLLAFGEGTAVPRASVRLEQKFYNFVEYHAFTTTPTLMPNQNDEIRHWSWTISRVNGAGQLDTRSTINRWTNSDVTGPKYDIEYALLNTTNFILKGQENIATIGVNSGSSQQVGLNMTVDTVGNAIINASGVTTLVLGNQISQDLVIDNPGFSTGRITANKPLWTAAKEIRANGMPNGVQALSAISAAVGFIFAASTDANGYGDLFSNGPLRINRDAAGFATSERMLYVYNNSNLNDSLFHVRGNGSIWTKGVVNIQSLKTTLTAPVTQGTTKMVIADTNGLLSNTDILGAANLLEIQSGNYQFNDAYMTSLPNNQIFAKSRLVRLSYTTPDADFSTLATRQEGYFILPDITANRTFTMFSGTGVDGVEFYIYNGNTSGTFNWSFTGVGVVKASNGASVTTLTNGVLYHILGVYNGTARWIVVNQ